MPTRTTARALVTATGLSFTRAASLAVAATVGLGAFASAASAQCTPAWNYSIPGVSVGTGYVGAFTMYQGDLIASGSFMGIGGVTGTKYLARYNIASNTWSAFGAGLGDAPSNSFGTSFAEMNGDLYVGGFYADANGVADTKSISRWDGTQFHSLGTGWAFNSVNAVWSMKQSDLFGGPKVFFGGGFDNLAGQPAGCVGAWDGTTLTPIVTSMPTLVSPQGSINPLVTAMEVFDDGQGGGPQLYIGGRFNVVDGVPALTVARWNGTTWSAVGTNLGNTIITAEVDAMFVWNDGNGPALYVGGSNLRVNGTLAQVAKWNGTTWTAVGQNPTGRVWTLAAFDDGTGEKLYAGGTAAGLLRVFRLDGNTWTTVEGGADAQVIKLFPHDGRLYMGGSFNNVNGQAATKIAFRTSCVNPCPPDINGDGNLDPDDLADYIACYFTPPCDQADYDGSGSVDPDDLSDYIAAYFGGC